MIDMTSTQSKNYQIQICLTALMAVIFILFINACTIKREPVQPGVIPRLAAPGPADEEFGERLFQKLRKEYDLDSDNLKHDKLIEVFNKLTQAAEVDHLSWNIYLLNGPEIVDIRSVHGNYIFVWSGVFDAVANEDELAGLLACELSHTLAHHTDPVEFTLASEAFFGVAEIATSMGLMLASQGMVVISGQGWMRWAYVEASDLDPLDREYSEENEREAAGVAFLIVSRAQYSPQALVDFWQRAAEDDSEDDKYDRLSRNLSPPERATMLEEVISIPELQNLEGFRVQASVVKPSIGDKTVEKKNK
ncbi:MAG: M48 family metalloprotease [bacterium]|nr:M48 family metalloprotease [bacterium]